MTTIKKYTPQGHQNTLEDLCSYSSKTFSIRFTGTTLEVYRERDKTLIEIVNVTEDLDGNIRRRFTLDPDNVKAKFRELKEKYILDYANQL